MTKARFDAIIVGSGIGGLAAAKLLASKGKKRVLVLEQHTRLGGMTHSFDRRGYHFGTGVHYIGATAGGALASAPDLLRWMSDGEAQFSPLPEVFDRLFTPTGEVGVPRGLDNYASVLKARFPDEAAAIDAYFEDARRAASAVGRSIFLKSLPGPRRWMLKRLERHCPLAFETTESVLRRRFRSKALRSILAAQWGDYGVPPSRSAFGFHAVIAVMHYEGGAVYPVGGSDAVTEAIVDGLRSSGVELRTGWSVQRICTERRRWGGYRVTGVEAVQRSSGETASFESRTVISDAGSANTFGRLLDRRQPSKPLTDLPRNPSGLVLFLGLSRSPAEWGADGANHWILPQLDHDEVAQAEPGEGLLYVSFPSLKNPAAMRPTLEVVSITEPNRLAAWKGSGPTRGDGYRAAKHAVTERILERLEAHLPGLREAVDHAELGTPRTFERYQASERGAFYGLACSPERLRSPWAGARTPVGGLFLAGQDAASPGVMGALFGGLMAGAAALGALDQLRALREMRDGRLWAIPAGRATRRRFLEVVDSRQESRSTKTLTLAALEPGERTGFDFTPGQFLRVEVPTEDGAVPRSYSISSPPAKSRTVELTVKRVEGGRGSTALHELPAKRALRVSGPYGSFTFVSGDAPAFVGIGGGVGLTPLMSVLRQLVIEDLKVPVALVSAQRSQAELLFHDELTRLSREREEVAYHPVVEQPDDDWTGATGRVDAALVQRLVSDYPEAQFHLCGPEPMMDACRQLLSAAGVDATRVRSESFASAPVAKLTNVDGPEVTSEGAEVRFARAAKTLVSSSGQTVLEMARDGQIELHSACGVGVCGACKVQVTSGKTDSPPTDQLSPAETEAGFVLACQAVPVGSVVIDA